MPVDTRGNMASMEKNQHKQLTSRIEKLEALLHQGLNDIKSQMSSKEGDQGNLADSIHTFENKFCDSIEDIKSELENINQRMIIQHKEVETLKRDYRSKFLVINGIDEKEKEDLLDVVVKLINQKLKLSISNINIDTCYRMGKERQDKKPRPLAVKFVIKWMKQKVFAAKKNLKGSGVVISEMLYSENRILLLEVRESVGARNCWTYEELEFTQDMVFKMSIYTFTLILNDTSYVKKDVNSWVGLPIHLVFKNIPESITMLKLYPSMVRIFRSAGPLARVSQPKLTDGNYINFSLQESSKLKGIFRITNTGGIIFVHDYLKLRNVTAQYLSLNVSWTRDNKLEFDEIQVRVVIEPNQTCDDIHRMNNWSACSEYETIKDCLRKDSCALGTGGSLSVEMRKGPERCMWRGDDITTNITHLYSTCTPDVKTCPDGVCDSLERLHHSLCPQDCTTQAVWPLKVNDKTKHGIDEASGTVICDALGCQSIKSRRSESKKKDDKMKEQAKHGVLVGNDGHIQRENITMGALVSSKCDIACMAGIGAGTLFLIGCFILIMVYWRVRKTRKSTRDLVQKNNQELTAPLSFTNNRNGLGEPLSFNFQMASVNNVNDTTFISDVVNKYSLDPKWEYPRSQLVIEQTLGEGEFGKVIRAKAQNIAGKPGSTLVAVKTLKDDARESELNDLLSEYQLLKDVSHPNVIKLLGVCTSAGGPVYLIIEYAEYGSLRNYLRRTRHLQDNSDSSMLPEVGIDSHYDEPKINDITPKDLLSFAWQICNGMGYLSDMKLVHRDLATRNVLLNYDKVCKISDFGLTRDVYEDNAYLKRSKGRAVGGITCH